MFFGLILFDPFVVFGIFRRWALQRRAQEAQVPSDEQEKMLRNLEKRETEYMRLQRHKVGIDDFEQLTLIGRGAFGEVKFSIYNSLFFDFISFLYVTTATAYTGDVERLFPTDLPSSSFLYVLGCSALEVAKILVLFD